MTTPRLSLIMGLVLFAVMLALSLVHIAKVTVKVVDEDGRPVDTAQIELCFYGGCLTKDATKGKTNKNGIFSAFGSSSDGVTGGNVQKAGYYSSGFHKDHFIKTFCFWQPWNKQIKVVLRPVIKPVPMYVRNHNFLFPAINKDLGFDLMMDDWLPPYGAGVHRDFIFRVERIYKDSDNFDATLTITFPNNYDGIQVVKDKRGSDFGIGSEFQLPRVAPENGYQSKMIKRVSSGIYGFRSAKEDDNNYIFRVRSESENGKIKRAMYGKIMGDIRFGPVGGNGGFEMHYYLNPDYSRNLEFDPKKNLFTNLPEVEGVRLP